jgi:hypothetical protein
MPTKLTLLLVAVAIVMAAAGGFGPALAQDAPAPAECTVAPIDPAAFAAALAIASAATLPTHVAAKADLPAGAPLDAATLTAVTATIRMVVACSNAGNKARLATLLTSGALFRAAGLRGTPIAASAVPRYATAIAGELATPTAPRPPEKRIVLLAVRGGRTLTDGRVGVIVETHNRATGATRTNFFVLAQVNGAWRSDEAVTIGHPFFQHAV